MSLSRIHRKHLSAVAKYESSMDKPPTRKQAKAWLAPIREAFKQMRTGEVDSHRGYAITRIHWADEDFARIDHAIHGFSALIERVMPGFDLSAMNRVAKKLEAGVLLMPAEVEACFVLLNEVEDRLIRIQRNVLKHAAQAEQIRIEFERMGIAA